MSENNWDIEDFTKKASQFLEKNFKTGLIIFAVLIVAASAWSYKKSLDQAAEKKAFAELYKTTKTYQKKKLDFTAAKESASDKSKDKTDVKVAATGDIQKDYGPEVSGLKDFLSNYNGTKASAEAALILSEIYADYGKTQEGADVLESTLSQWQGQSVLSNVMHMRAGDLWATIDNCEKASSHWSKVAKSESFVANQAKLKWGVCLQKLGQINQAEELFKKIQAQSPNTTEGFNAKRYLRFMKFKSQTPKEDSLDSKAQKKAKSSESPS